MIRAGVCWAVCTSLLTDGRSSSVAISSSSSLKSVTAVRVSKLTRARGPAGSWLDLICVDEASDDGLSAVTVLEKSRTDQLDGRARRLGATLGVPVDIRPAQQNA